MEEKKKFKKPTIEVVKLQHQVHLLQTSGIEATRDGYDEANQDVSSGEKNSSGIWTWY